MTYESPNERTKDFVINIKNYFNQQDNITIYDKRNIIKIIEFENKKYVVKSFKKPHLLNQIVYRFFRDSKARRSFDNSYKLRKMGINTPLPIGYIEFPTRFRFLESFYISEFYDFDFEIRAVFSDKNFEDRENILKKFIEFTYKLHKKNVYHIDYSPGNILVKKTTYGYEFSIIDVNRMKFMEFDDELRMKSLAKLTNDLEDNTFMVRTYANISKIDEAILLPKLKFSLEEQGRYLDNKKRFNPTSSSKISKSHILGLLSNTK
jgi:tRNA A-37 threonylcarbamoyl transferase component Bud32